jgi:hypothetical protein
MKHAFNLCRDFATAKAQFGQPNTKLQAHKQKNRPKSLLLKSQKGLLACFSD